MERNHNTEYLSVMLESYQALCQVESNSYRVPTDTGKPGKMRQLFPVREKSGNFENVSKSQGILNESGKSQGKLSFIN